MRVTLLQVNTTVGDITGNAELIAQGVREATAQGSDLVVTPELALVGCPPRNLLHFATFTHQSWEALRKLATDLHGQAPVLVGLPQFTQSDSGHLLFNAAALLHNGTVVACYHQTHIPDGDAFEERAYFTPGQEPQLLCLGGHRIGIVVGADLWTSPDSQLSQMIQPMVDQDATCIINMAASPFTSGKQKKREAGLIQTAQNLGIPILFANQVGGNDEFVFDGRSTAVNATGMLVGQGPAFASSLVHVDLPSPGHYTPAPDGAQVVSEITSVEEEIWHALVLGTRDFVTKCGLHDVILGLSGGIDSALVAAIAAAALGPDHVLGVLMPSPYSSTGSITDSLDLARNLGIPTMNVPIAPAMTTFNAMLALAFADVGPNVAEENIQARARGMVLMAISNKRGGMVLTTGNKSEISVGYCTLYGDMNGGLAVISDLPKTMVYTLSRWLNRQQEVIPQSIIDKPPSAELRPDQTDQDSLPPYEVLDAILNWHIDQHEGAKDIVARGFNPEVVRHVLSLVKGAEFKRKQAAPGLKVTSEQAHLLWHMPIAKKISF